LGTFVFVGSGHVGISMFIIVIKLIILITEYSCDKFMKFELFYEK
jgi:hypothetical protein